MVDAILNERKHIMIDTYARELERTIFNWYYGGEDSAPNPVFNALHHGLSNNMQVLVPIETPNTIVQMMGNPAKINAGDTFSIDESVPIKFRHLGENEKGEYYIPIFTSREQLEKGETSSTINQSLKVLVNALNSWKKCLGYILNPWDNKLILSREMLDVILKYTPKSHIEFVRGSVVDMHADAIVNAANRSLLGGGGVDGAIHKAAGPELLSECRTLHGCETGESKITKAYNISYADHIIHTVGPVYHGKEKDAELLSACYYNSLDLAYRNSCRSIAFPCVSTGVYGYPLDEAAKISLMTAVRWLDDHEETVMNIYFCCYKDAELESYQKLTK